ncbi:DUF1800 domain-containing protein [Variovorax sp. PAMC 28711]|uniref:DUF1800 domain-containing protein n=1 Tax=Variovorax sp. PAMC 28711 TaxID=1795631 RepID=UPI00078C1C97|nr:DUF1800 family protein [Variovorax sp. PAMC 28711]AMM24915.1 hypothetical protein AX767_11500 [Variovorax sp. PAMC 28711]
MVEIIEDGRVRATEDAVPAVEGAETPGTHGRLAAALAASSALVACGGGGGGGGSGLGLFGAPGANGTAAAGSTDTTVQAGSLTAINNTATASTYVYTQAKTDAEAARFLLQAQFSASDADIAAVRAKGYLPWLGEQMDMAPTQTGWDWLNSKAEGTASVDSMIWQQLMKSTDAVRKRMALVFSEIFVVSANDIGSNWPDLLMAGYWDTMVAGVTTNFRKLIEDVTLNPAMGFYLNTRGNQKENNNGRQPDENYGREVMQLMTLGLVQLNPDGTTKTGADGAPMDSYTQDDVTNIARVFTGYDLDIKQAEKNSVARPGYTIESSAWTRRPMVLTASNHSTLASNFLGATVPASTPGAQALKIALDTLVAHPNTAPFICKQVIQRLVTSNPSPAYVARVAAVFVDNGAGVRGDMKSVFAAVLLDNEARSPAGLTDANFGRLREPMLRFVQWGRTFGIQSTLDTWGIGARSDAGNNGLGQSPLRSPSVFNFFRPGYVPPSTAMAAARLVAPEFQLVNETSVGGYLNFMQNILQNGFNNKDVVATYTVEKTLVLDPPALVARLNLLMTGNELSAATVALIVGALVQPAVTAGSPDGVKLNRVTAAVLLVLASAEYLIQK